MNNILALIDFTEVSDNVLKHASQWAKNFGAKCWLVHVSSPDPEFVGYDIGPQYIRDDRSRHLKEEHRKLWNKKKELEKEGLECEALLIQGPASEIIFSEIKKLNIDLIVIGNNRHGQLYEAVVGSIGRAVLHKANIPVVVVP